MPRFEEYYQPQRISDLVELLLKYGKDARILAGGTDVVPRIKAKAWKPKAVIGIWDIPGLDTVEVFDDHCEIGCMANLMKLSHNEALFKDYRIIPECAGHVSSQQVRNMATLGGNACNASPSADAVHGPFLLDADVVLMGPSGTRTMKLADFVTGPGRTALEPGEFLLKFVVYKPEPNSTTDYQKFAIRGDSDIAITGSGVFMTLADDDTILNCRITEGSVGPKTLRMYEQEKMAIGQKATEDFFWEISDAVAGAVTPITDQRGTKEWRVDLVRYHTRRAFEEAYFKLRGKKAE